MRLEEIAHRLSTAVTVNDFREIEDDIRNHIVERDEPVTREWLESGESGLVKRKTTLGAVYFSSAGTLIAYHPAKNQWFLNGGSVDLKITTRGQLLDLLSGLGVRK